VEVDPRRRTLKLSSFDGLKPAPANKRFMQVKIAHFLEHAKIWGVACNIGYQEADLHRIIFKGIILASFRGILNLKHKAHVKDAGIAVPERSKTFKECLQEAANVIGLRRDDFVRRSSFFGMTWSKSESQNGYLRRCEEAAKRADLKGMSIEDHAMHAYMSSCGLKVR
jgi:hypothetical protein